MRAEHLADGGENLIDRVEADAADEMNVHSWPYCKRHHSAASRGGGRTLSTPSAAVAEIVVRTM